MSLGLVIGIRFFGGLGLFVYLLVKVPFGNAHGLSYVFFRCNQPLKSERFFGKGRVYSRLFQTSVLDLLQSGWYSNDSLFLLNVAIERCYNGIKSSHHPDISKLRSIYGSVSKRDSVHLLPTLYIKQLPLPNTILPIRGTLGRVQGVVFESDFCHTNFRTTVAYDKFTNNFWIDKIEERWPLFVATSLRFTEH